MTTPNPTETTVTPPPPPSKQSPPRQGGHRLLKAAVVTTVVLAVLVLIVHAVPEVVARYVIKRELDRMGIVSEGVPTLNIDLWRRRAFIGPMRFGVEPENQGQVGGVWVTFRLVNLLSEQAVIEKMIIDGVDIQITRETNGEIIVNGIELSKLMATDEDAEPAPEGEGGWGAGLDEFELRNSRVFFTDRARGTINLDVERLSLAGFRTWEPDDPGTFELVGTFNEMPFKWKGEARPFAEKLTLSVEGTVDEADFTKIENFSGSLGFQEQSGSLSTKFRHDITVFPSGRVEVASRGEVLEQGIDTIHPGGFAIRFEEGVSTLDTRLVLDENGNTEVEGTVRIVWKRGGIGVGGAVVDFDDVTLDLEDLDLSVRADGPFALTATPRLAILAPKLSGAVNGQGDRIGIDLSELKVEQAEGKLSLAAAGRAALGGFTLSLPQAVDGAAVLGLSFADATLDLGKVSLSADAGTLRVDAAPRLTVQSLALEQPIEAETDRLEIDISALKVEQAGDSLSVAATGKSVLGPSSLSLPNEPAAGEPFQLAFTGAELDLTRLVLALKEGGLRLDAAPRLSVDALDLRGPAQATAERLDVTLATLDLTTSGEDIAVKVSGAADLSSLKASVPATEGTPAMRMSAEHINTNVGEAMVANTGPERHWQAQLDATIAALAADIAEGAIAQAKWRELSLSGVRADQALNVGADTLEIGGLEIEFNDKLFSAFETGASAEGKQTAEEKAETPARAPVIKLQRLVLSDTARIRFHDSSVTPEVTIDVDVEKLEVAEIDTGDPSQKTDLHLAATVNEFTKLRVSGWTQAFAANPSFDLKGKVENVQLASFSPYAAKAVGLNLESGVLNADAGGKANEGKLAATVKLDVVDLDFSALSEEDAARLSSQVGLPIETAVGLLEDSDGRIELELPVSGTVAEPDVDVSQAIGRAIGGALKSIFPPTAIASMLASGFEGAGVKFKSIPFAAGDAKLGPEGEEIAANMAQLLKQRPKLRLRVCGRATAADFDAYLANALGPKTAAEAAPATAAQAAPPAAPPTSPQANAPRAGAPAAALDSKQVLAKARSDLTELATERGRAVRRYVVDGRGIGADSLGECLAKFDSTDQGPPRAKVKF